MKERKAEQAKMRKPLKRRATVETKVEKTVATTIAMTEKINPVMEVPEAEQVAHKEGN